MRLCSASLLAVWLAARCLCDFQRHAGFDANINLALIAGDLLGLIQGCTSPSLGLRVVRPVAINNIEV